MKTFLLLFLIITSLNISTAQNQNSIWMFGDSAGINFSNINNPVPVHSSVKSRGSCSSIAAQNGNLLFYSYTRATITGPTTLVKNKEHNLMLNGDSIIGQGWYNEVTILPSTIDSNLYFLFSIGITNSSLQGVFYSIIDLTQDSGRGEVIQKNIQLENWEATDCLLAIKHGNGKDWWVIAREGSFSTGSSNNNWSVYLLDSSGIHPQPLQVIGSLNSTSIGNLVFDKVHNKLLFTNYKGLVELYDFDRCTGIISNTVTIEPESTPPFPALVGSAFSPSGQYLYVSTNDIISYLYQYDLLASNIQASKVTIDSFTDYEWAGGFLRLAPDNKIYYSRVWDDGWNYPFPYPDTLYNVYNTHLSVINDPDQPGLACNFTPFSFYLGGKRTYYGLPNNPDYELGPLAGSACDTIISVEENLSALQKKFYFHPNPSAGEFKINFNLFEDDVIEIRNSIGQVVFVQNGSTQVLNLHHLQDGLYLGSVISSGKRVLSEILLIIK